MRKLKLDELNRLSIEDYKSLSKMPVTVVLDSIRSALNVGSIFRTSDAFAVERVLLCGITARPPHREITKTAIGATESVEWAYFEEISDCILSLREEKNIIIGIEQTDVSQKLQDFIFSKENKYAVIFGNEVNGITEKCLSIIDHFVEIPQFGTKHSLNISVCTGIVLWHAHQGMRKSLLSG